MASILTFREVGDLIVGKPKLQEFHHSASVREALAMLIQLNDFELPVWRLSRKKSFERFGPKAEKNETPQGKEERFVGMLSMLDIMDHLTSDESLNDPVGALNVAVFNIMTPNPNLLKYVASGTRLIDALGLIKGGTRRLLVPMSSGFQRVSRRFSLHKSAFFIRPDPELILSMPDKPVGYCCLTVEDVARFLLGCLGALAPFSLRSIGSQGIVNANPPQIGCDDPAKKALRVWRQVPAHIQAVAVVEVVNGKQLLIGEVSAIKMMKCGFRVALALATLSAAEFVAYMEHFGGSTGASDAEKLWSDSMFLASVNYQIQYKGQSGSMSLRSRITPLTCKSSNSVAAVMAQMLAYRTTHVWVTEEDGVLVGIVTYPDIMAALTTIPSSLDKLMASVIAKDIHGGSFD